MPLSYAKSVAFGAYGVASPQHFGAYGDGSEDDTIPVQEAVAAAVAAGGTIYWPPGTYKTTESIPGLHTVKHSGPGVITRDGNSFYPAGINGQSNTLYCDAAAADDLSDGLSTNDPIQQIKTAAEYLSNYGPSLDATWTIQCAAGTYEGGIQIPRNLESRYYVTIKGPAKNHPEVPTAIINRTLDTLTVTGSAANDTLTHASHGLANGTIIQLASAGGTIPAPLAENTFYYVVNTATDTFKVSEILGGTAVGLTTDGTGTITATVCDTPTYGIYGTDVMLWLEDLKFTGIWNTAVYVSTGSILQWRNVHVDGSSVGLAAYSQVVYYGQGGIIENCYTAGIAELFSTVRSWTVGSDEGIAEQLILRNNKVGLKAKENCVGHLDYVNFEDNEVGLELQLFSGTNPKHASFLRNTVGIVLVNSELHNEDGVDYGTGADANGSRILSLGNSNEIATWGWPDVVDSVSQEGQTIRVGHRPLVMIGNTYSGYEHTGTVSSTTIFPTSATDATYIWNNLQCGMYNVRGKQFRVVVKGEVKSGVTLAADAEIKLLIAGSYAAQFVIPSGAVGPTATFVGEFSVSCPADGNNQLVSVVANIHGLASYVDILSRTFTLDDTDHSITIECELGNTADALIFKSIEVFG